MTTAERRSGGGGEPSADGLRDRCRVLVVDDEPDMADSIAFFVERAGHDVEISNSGADALARMEQRAFDIVLTDLRMPRMSGLALLAEVKARSPDCEVLVVTGHPEIDTAVEAMKQGAFDYVTKPFDERQLMDRVEKAAAHHRVTSRNEGLRKRLRRKGGAGHRLVYRSVRFARTMETLERAARTDASVLIQGESGTGKELLAHHLHDSSARAGQRFVPVDCATMPENLVESELFGHVKGAFSGAAGQKMGLFQVADGGTLFLDEIGELPLPFQVKLLRAIQEREIRRVGGTETTPVDVRIVCATNRNLQQEVEAGRFRQDLYYRLDVVRIEVPPLRERIEDVEALARFFLDEFRRETGDRSAPHDFSAEALIALKSYSWPGNVRQLKNAIDRACALGGGRNLEVDDLPDEVGRAVEAEAAIGVSDGRPLGSFQEMKARKVAAIESTYVSELLRRHDGNVTRSAEEAGMSRSAFQKLMQRYGIKSSDFRATS